jgi:hypothetical protein
MTHTVVQGDFMSSIAKQYGFLDYLTIWNHPGNGDLKKKRSDPNVLYPGDRVLIPDKRQKSEFRPTTAIHTFRLHVDRVKLRIALRDFDDRPIVAVKCELEIAGEITQHTSDSEGVLERLIRPEPAVGSLRIPDLDFELAVRVGSLDPSDEDSGSVARLTNLGYLDPFVSPDDDDLNCAIQEFQCDHKLPVTGTIDSATSARLKDLHGA